MLYGHPEVMVSNRPGEDDKPVRELVVIQKPKGVWSRFLKPRVRQYLDVPVLYGYGFGGTPVWESRWHYYPSMKPVKPYDKSGLDSKELKFINDMLKIHQVQEELSTALDRHIEL